MELREIGRGRLTQANTFFDHLALIGRVPQDGGEDVFVHISAVERADFNGFNEGQVVECEEVANK
jgi:hypothetical protein